MHMLAFRTPRSATPASHVRWLLRGPGRVNVRDEEGQALVEFTLVALPFLLLLFGIAYFGLALNGWIDETHLASEAARFAAVNNQEPGKNGKGLLEWTKEQGDTNFVKNAEATICSPTGSSIVGEPVEVKLKFTYKWLPLLGVGETSPVTSKAVARIEVQPSTPYEKC
jgi:Flp pilus assembly protein TadG